MVPPGSQVLGAAKVLFEETIGKGWVTVPSTNSA